MKFEDLSKEDQALLQTDLGDFDKIAQEEVAAAQEMYQMGHEKLAAETADYIDSILAMDKEAEEKEEEKEEEKDEEQEKKASELASFIERGYFDGLQKLGSERHGDAMFYIYPFLEEKIAGKAAEKAGKSAIQKLWGAIKGYHKGAVSDIKGGAKEFADKWKGHEGKAGKAGGKAGKAGGPGYMSAVGKMGKGTAKLVGPYGATGGAAYLAAKKKSED